MSENSQQTQPAQPAEARAGTLDASPLSPASLSGPNVVRYRAVSERDIATLRHIEKPVFLAVAALFTGIFLAASYPVYELIGVVRGMGANISPLDLGIVMGWALAFGVAITAAFASIRKRSKILDTLDAIRTRPQLPAARKPDTPRPTAKKRTRFGLKPKRKKK